MSDTQNGNMALPVTCHTTTTTTTTTTAAIWGAVISFGFVGTTSALGAVGDFRPLPRASGRSSSSLRPFLFSLPSTSHFVFVIFSGTKK